MKIGILGYGKQGISALHYWHTLGHEVTVCDKDTSISLPSGVTGKLGKDYLENLDKFDLLIRSPGLHPSEITSLNDVKILEKVTSNTNEFMRIAPTQNIIGVTGTKGKGTTSTIIAEMLKKAGRKVFVGGNIGTPPLDLLEYNMSASDYVVLELANFQLIDIKYSPKYAVALMVEPEHLDWHKSTEEYITAKQQMFRWQKSSDTAIYYKLNELSKSVASVSPGKKLAYFDDDTAHIKNNIMKIGSQKICDVSEVKLPGEHNLQNICAAATCVWEITHDLKAIRDVAVSMSGLPFRIEKRGVKAGIEYYNDSFSSAPPATIAAILSITKNKVLIIGGKDRNLSLVDLAKTIKNSEKSINRIILIGESKNRLKDSLEEAGFNEIELCESRNMTDIVNLANSFAKSGDAVVLSPGFPSFDMFKNFEDRGIQFNEAVAKL